MPPFSGNICSNIGNVCIPKVYPIETKSKVQNPLYIRSGYNIFSSRKQLTKQMIKMKQEQRNYSTNSHSKQGKVERTYQSLAHKSSEISGESAFPLLVNGTWILSFFFSILMPIAPQSSYPCSLEGNFFIHLQFFLCLMIYWKICPLCNILTLLSAHEKRSRQKVS